MAELDAIHAAGAASHSNADFGIIGSSMFRYRQSMHLY